MALRMTGKVVLVMGAGSSGPGIGNGRASAMLYAREGATAVVCVDIDLASAQETVRMIEADTGAKEQRQGASETAPVNESNPARAIALQGDVTDATRVAAIVAEVMRRYGQIDVLHNNVGITAMGGPVDESIESWHHVMDTNVTAMFLAVKYVLPHMLKSGKGAIVNIASLAGIRVTPYPYTSYYASKAAVVHMTTSIGLQYAREGIRANAIAPGLMNTPMVHKQIAGQYASPEAMVQARDAMSPTGKMGDAWDVAHAAVFLVSDDAKFINGVVLPVDGGQHALMR